MINVVLVYPTKYTNFLSAKQVGVPVFTYCVPEAAREVYMNGVMAALADTQAAYSFKYEVFVAAAVTNPAPAGMITLSYAQELREGDYDLSKEQVKHLLKAIEDHLIIHKKTAASLTELRLRYEQN